jgi:hypothetical protein
MYFHETATEMCLILNFVFVSKQGHIQHNYRILYVNLFRDLSTS